LVVESRDAGPFASNSDWEGSGGLVSPPRLLLVKVRRKGGTRGEEQGRVRERREGDYQAHWYDNSAALSAIVPCFWFASAQL